MDFQKEWSFPNRDGLLYLCAAEVNDIKAKVYRGETYIYNYLKSLITVRLARAPA